MRLPRLIADALEVSRLPGLKIEMSGDAGCRLLYGVFTSRHPRWRLIQNSRWGVALIALPRTSDEYLRHDVPLELIKYTSTSVDEGYTVDAVVLVDGVETAISGEGNGPLSAFVDALGSIGFEVRVPEGAHRVAPPGRKAEAQSKIAKTLEFVRNAAQNKNVSFAPHQFLLELLVYPAVFKLWKKRTTLRAMVDHKETSELTVV